MNIFIFRNGEVSGPFSRAEIFAGLREGTFSKEDTACTDGGEDWKPLRALLSGKLGVGTSKEPAANSTDTEASTHLEPAANSFPPEATTPGFVLPSSTLPSAEGPPLPPKPRRRSPDGKLKLLVSRVKDLAAIGAALGLLFSTLTVATFAIGRSKFLHTTNIVAIQSSQNPPAQPIKPGVPPAGGGGEDSSGEALSGVSGSVPALAENAAPSNAALISTARNPTHASLPATPVNQQAVQAGSTGVRPTKGQTKIAAEKKLFEIPRFTSRELLDVLKERFAATPVNAASSLVRPDPNVTVREGSFLLDTGMAWNPQIEVVYSIPLYKNSVVGPRAANVLLWASNPWAMAPLKEELVDGKPVRKRSGHYGWMAYYARELGYTTFSFHCVTRTWNDPEETYFLGGPRWVDLVFKAQAELTRIFKLPPRKLVMTGVSVGASFVERVAAARPDQVAAVTLLDAPEISLPKQPSDTLWYMQFSRGDSMQAQYNTLYNALLNQNAKVLFDIIPPDYGARGIRANMYHTESALSVEATRSFLDGVAGRRDAVGNLDPTTWPFVRDRDHPYFILSRNSPNLDRIVPAKREFLPSERMVRCLQSLPVPVHAVMLLQPNGLSTRCFVGLPPLGRPRGVLVYAPQVSYQGITDMFNDMYFLSEKGYLVLCPYTTQSSSHTLDATLKFVQDTPLLNVLPVVLIGVVERATQLWQGISKSNLTPAAMALLKFRPENLLDESKLTVGSHPIRFPVLFVEDEAQLLKAATSTDVKANLADAHQIDDYIARSRERHQIARVILIPASDSSEERNAQKTVQAINDSFADLVEGHRGAIIK